MQAKHDILSYIKKLDPASYQGQSDTVREQLISVVHNRICLFRGVDKVSRLYGKDLFVFFAPSIKQLVCKQIFKECRNSFRVHDNVNYETSAPELSIEKSQYLIKLIKVSMPYFMSEELKINGFDKKLIKNELRI